MKRAPLHEQRLPSVSHGVMSAAGGGGGKIGKRAARGHQPWWTESRASRSAPRGSRRERAGPRGPQRRSRASFCLFSRGAIGARACGHPSEQTHSRSATFEVHAGRGAGGAGGFAVRTSTTASLTSLRPLASTAASTSTTSFQATRHVAFPTASASTLVVLTVPRSVAASPYSSSGFLYGRRHARRPNRARARRVRPSAAKDGHAQRRVARRP